jgi:hypothetical protein
MANLHRAQLLLAPEQHQALAEIARREGRSISDLVREIIQRDLAEREQATWKRRETQAIEELARIRETLRETHGDYPGNLVAEVRAEREAEMERLWRGER